MKMNNKYNTALQKTTIISDTLSHYIYVQPYVFKFLLTLSIALPIKAKDMDWKKDYFVATKKFHSKNRNQGFLHFVTDEVSAIAINSLLRNKPQFMFPSKKGLPFDEKESILTIDGISIKIVRNDPRFKICKLLFGDEKLFGKQWDIIKFIKKSKLENPDVIENYYKYLHPKVRHLNKKIAEIIGLNEVIDIDKNSIGINPSFLPLFLN